MRRLMTKVGFDQLVKNQTPDTAGRRELHLRVLEDLTYANAAAFGDGLTALFERGVPIVRLDLHPVSIIDSSGIGALVKAHKLYKESRGQLILVDPGPSVRNILKILRLDQEIPIEFSDAGEAEGSSTLTGPTEGLEGKSRMPDGVPGGCSPMAEMSLVKRLKMAEILEDQSTQENGVRVVLLVKMDLTVANAELFRECLDMYIEMNRTDLILDFSRIRFIDSSALGVLVRAARTYEKAGGQITLIRPNESIKKIMRVVRLDQMVSVQDRLPD